jgi:hypothetical protein
MKRALQWPMVIASSGLTTAVLAVIDVHGPVRVVVTLWFLFICTGMAFVPLLGIRPLAYELALGVVVSIVLDTLIATALILAGSFTEESGFVSLGGLCLVGCALQVLLLPSSPEPRPATASQS